MSAENQTTREQQLEATLRALLEASPEIGEWMFDVMPPSQRDAYARARGRAKEALAHGGR